MDSAIDPMGPRPNWELPATTELVTNIFFIALALWAMFYTIRLARRVRHQWPLWLLLGGICAISYEVIADHLGGATYPEQGVVPIFSAWGRQLPLYVFFIYFSYFGLVAVRLMEKLDAGEAQRRWWRFYAYHVVGVFAFEPIIIYNGIWKYWGGNQPFGLFGFPAWWWFANSAMLFNATAICYLVRRYLISRWQSWMMVPLFPLSVMGVHASVAIPVTLAIHSTTNMYLVNAASVLTIGLSLLVTWLVGKAVVPTADSPTAEPGSRRSPAQAVRPAAAACGPRTPDR